MCVLLKVTYFLKMTMWSFCKPDIITDSALNSLSNSSNPTFKHWAPVCIAPHLVQALVTRPHLSTLAVLLLLLLLPSVLPPQPEWSFQSITEVTHRSPASYPTGFLALRIISKLLTARCGLQCPCGSAFLVPEALLSASLLCSQVYPFSVLVYSHLSSSASL